MRELMVDSDWHRNIVGGMWEEIGRLQFDFLVEKGLKTDCYFLDVGCGSLRGGVHFIRYLEPGHYFGIDKSKELLDAGRNVELKRYNLLEQNPILIQMDNFRTPDLARIFCF
jgi:SAM-dependent methyltransferase